MSSSAICAADDVMLLDIFARYQRSERFQRHVWAQLWPSSVWSTSRRRAHGVVSIRQVKGVAIVYLEETNLIKPFLVFLAAAQRRFVVDLPVRYFSYTKER